MHDLTEHELIEKALQENPLAFRYLVEKHQKMTYRLAYRFLNNPDDAKDISQEAFIRIWKNLNKYKAEIKFSTWLYKITTNLCLDFLKSKHHRQTRNLTTEFREPRTLITPENNLEQQELAAFIHQAAQSLTPKQQAVFILRDLEDLPTEEIEVALGIGSGAIKSNLYHARRAMQQKISQWYHIPAKPIQYEL